MSDKYMTTILSIVLGIFFLIVGFISIPFLAENSKILGFTFICLATGFYKPALLAEISRPEKDRSKKATTYYYAISNLSTIMSGFVAGTIINFFRVEYVFFLLAGLLIPTLYIALSSLSKNVQNIKWIKGLSLTVLNVGGVFIFLSNGVFLKTVLPFLLFGMMAYFFKEKALRQKNILFALIVFLIFAMFIEIFSGATTLFIEHHIYRNLGSYTIPTSFFHSVNPFLIVTITSFIILFKIKLPSSTLLSYFECFVFLVLSAVLLTACARLSYKFHLVLLILMIFCQTIAELLIVPKVLQALGMNISEEDRQKTMSLWLGCISGAHILSSNLSDFFLNTVYSPTQEEFFIFYLFLGTIALCISLVLGICYLVTNKKDNHTKKL